MPPVPALQEASLVGVLILAVFILAAWGAAVTGTKAGRIIGSIILILVGLTLLATSRGAIHEVSAALFIVGGMLLAGTIAREKAEAVDIFVPTSLYRGVPYIAPAAVKGQWRTAGGVELRALIDGTVVGFTDLSVFMRFVDDMVEQRRAIARSV